MGRFVESLKNGMTPTTLEEVRAASNAQRQLQGLVSLSDIGIPTPTSELPEPVSRLLEYAGKRREQRGVVNPCISAREAIVIADWIVAQLAEPQVTAKSPTKQRDDLLDAAQAAKEQQ